MLLSQSRDTRGVVRLPQPATPPAAASAAGPAWGTVHWTFAFRLRRAEVQWQAELCAATLVQEVTSSRQRSLTAPPVCPADRRFLPREFRAEVPRLRADADAPEIETVGVPADLHRQCVVRASRRMTREGDSEELEALVVEVDERPTEGFRELRGSGAVLWVGPVAFTATVVEVGEEFDHLDLRDLVVSRDSKAVLANPLPVIGAVKAEIAEHEAITRRGKDGPEVFFRAACHRSAF